MSTPQHLFPQLPTSGVSLTQSELRDRQPQKATTLPTSSQLEQTQAVQNLLNAVARGKLRLAV
ncbi:MAG: hypothetical protein SVX43_19030 [Cyanobacteriota bacterium]|nr:hypothetical protein [Cyanobacteriota bacterium]